MPTATEIARHLSKLDLVKALDVIDTARHVGSEQQMKRLMHLASELIPLEKVHICVAALDADANIVSTTRQMHINFPLEWLNQYREREYFRVDPVARELFGAGRPLLWHELRKRNVVDGAKQFYADARDFGLNEGFSFGARFSQSSSASFFTCICDEREMVRHRRHAVMIEFLTPHLHEALAKVHLGLLKEAPVLSDREREALNWAKFGKTDWEISLQMGIGARTVKFHLENAMRKLQANNRVQAMAIALSQGLIDWG
ncbi:helix-turn-helix transcriptional regulator [Solimonas variicoloris]|uniref:helix-turn-helix transcriptional regulator n=1 Tax=Solimonas variicoloris TaxID=254408 RepID=UPI0003732B50|nr:LuxR family transcriptional regulator [Solimonas variicoloris]